MDGGSEYLTPEAVCGMCTWTWICLMWNVPVCVCESNLSIHALRVSAECERNLVCSSALRPRYAVWVSVCIAPIRHPILRIL